MNREVLAAEALAAGQAAEHNLQMITREPERMVSSKKLVDGITYLNTMIKFAEAEVQMKNDRRPGQSRLRTHLKNLVVFILRDDSQKGKGEIA
ncbi:hypothetical protein [Paenibacillus motobuensis]|uniref:hypothetical protein n=1 Tax=Paenibacillus motobuensis TaxID=295324 RepID=UPI0031D86E06